MRIRPWPIVILAAIQVLAPLFTMIASMWVWGVSAEKFTSILWRGSSRLELLEFYGLGIISGFALYRTRSWSYPVFLAVTAYSVYRSFQSLQPYSREFSLLDLALLQVPNVLLVAYFLIPAVRETYFNPKVRWWETKARYRVEIPARANSDEVIIENISEGGAFIRASKPPRSSSLLLTFEFRGERYEIACYAVRFSPDEREIGVKFDSSRTARRRVRALIDQLKKAGCATTLLRAPWHQELLLWAKRLFLTGRGWTPEVPKHLLSARDSRSEDRRAA